MISRILAFSIQRRWLVVLLSLGAVVLGAWSLARLPIDAVPDITNKQVQVNTTAPALSPAEIEKQVTLRIETALAGIPGLESTRSLSRNGFSQVTAVFTERTDIYFARQQVNERLLELRAGPAARRRAEDGADLDRSRRNLHVDRRLCARYGSAPGQPGRSRGSYVTPEGRTAYHEVERAAYLRTVQDWIIRPQIKSVPRRCRRRFDRRLRQAVPGPAGSREADRARPLVRRCRPGHRSQQCQPRRQHHRAQRRGHRGAHRRPAREHRAISATSSSARAAAYRSASATSPASTIGGEIRTGSASENGHEVVVGTALMLIGSNSRTVADGGRCQTRSGDTRHAARRHRGQDRAQPHPTGRCHDCRPSPPISAKARCW